MDQGETQMELRVLDLTMTSGRRLMSQNLMSNTPNVPIDLAMMAVSSYDARGDRDTGVTRHLSLRLSDRWSSPRASDRTLPLSVSVTR